MGLPQARVPTFNAPPNDVRTEVSGREVEEGNMGGHGEGDRREEEKRKEG